MKYVPDGFLNDDRGSAVFENGKIKKINGVEQFTGPVEQGKHACIVIGRPAGGKSRVSANPLSNRYKARIIDSDVVKPWLDGFDGGYGAGYVQKEISEIMEMALAKAITRGDNIIVPKIGGKSILRLAEKMKKQGYTVDLYYNEVSEGTSIMRAASRFAEEGRYLSLSYLKSIGQKATRSFKDFAESGIFNYAEWRNNDVGFGEEPKLIWRTGKGNIETVGVGQKPIGGHGLHISELGETNRNGERETGEETKVEFSINDDAEKRNQLRGLHKTNAAILAESEGTKNGDAGNVHTENKTAMFDYT